MCLSPHLLTYLVYDSYCHIKLHNSFPKQTKPTFLSNTPLVFISAALKHNQVYIDELQNYVVNFCINVLCIMRHIIAVSCSVNIADIIENHSVLLKYLHGSLVLSPQLYNSSKPLYDHFTNVLHI